MGWEDAGDRLGVTDRDARWKVPAVCTHVDSSFLEKRTPDLPLTSGARHLGWSLGAPTNDGQKGKKTLE